MSNTPSDEEIVALARSEGIKVRTGAGAVKLIRAALAKWGTLRADKIVIPTDTMEQEFQQHYRRGYETGKKASTQQPTQVQAGAVPLTPFIPAQRERLYYNRPENVGKGASLADWHRIVQFIEAAHGIKGGQHG